MAYKVINPYSGKLVKEYELMSDDEIAEKLDQAEQFYKAQKKVPVSQRAKKLLNFAEVLEQNQDKLAKEAAINMGKRVAEGRGEVLLCVNLVRYYANKGPSLLEPKPYKYADGKKALLEHHSIGIVASIEPWNFPYSQVIRVLAPNYLLGNPVVLKHAGIVAGCAKLLEDLAIEADLGDGAFANLFVSHKQIAEIIADERVQGVALTGSEDAGRIIAGQAGKSLIKSTMELGGSDVFVILDDADLELAVNDAIGARLRNAGQVCTSAKRYVVEERVAEKFISGIKQKFTDIKLGDPLIENTELAPLSSKEAVEGLQKQVEEAIANGADVLVQGGPVEGDGYFFKPVVLTNIKPENPAYYQEFFGPVAQIHVVPDDEAVIELANDSFFGLAGAVYSQNVERAHAVASEIETGQVFINRPSGAHPELPFGGVKHSGYGREMSDLGLYEFANEKIIVFN
ncbi:NAD-dependent succinate-semialdehyde dehydrogenase [Liquorilactobacillus mali]|uniref:NAD-dependent aldehyde dehydrogenase n=1 Tax=Liquorilactobacillus mali KCTC 3596 = DSM 20444 TaxID=1046596 RepID=J1F0B0_9LACO|nr:NAD-dependent succinate-semialdehyde dehydrogenase [Liquorilactobacillus mali]EJE97386.1 putative NAD-dependent aldehyde dehydrogenase [Liquorilactobacillus mali KCTC 3596 = DSM 20444]KRN11395.1 NAD-dependent aldehyde dehydrogenase [Liquorilactobacillus mali KCTC 3596 = DSM 20444]MDC7953099.1 NAD-dependent succinate-semialdehyde dehydrogenase [Liquorilactobacillus mali]QFQ75270.1 NAD-dependent succinate-semialdehyde dehydrogenase [Liquorilactobacillus mali]